MKNMSPLEKNRSVLHTLAPSARYDGASPFPAWQKENRARLGSLLGLPLERCDDCFEIEYIKENDRFTETRFTFQSEPDYYVPCYFLAPAGAKGPLPTVICLQGHTKGMHISLGRTKYPGEVVDGDHDFAIRAIAEGCCALVLEQRNFGECGGTEEGPDCYRSTMTALLTGRTTIGERVWDVCRAIDVLLRRFPQADAQKLICLGNSGGGTATFYTACMEERIRIAVPACSVCTYEDSIAAVSHCSCNYIPNIRRYFEMGDLAGLIAPRPLIIVAGREDDIFPLRGVKASFEQARALYAAAGAPENCSLVVGEGGHRFYADDTWPVLRSYLR